MERREYIEALVLSLGIIVPRPPIFATYQSRVTVLPRVSQDY